MKRSLAVIKEQLKSDENVKGFCEKNKLTDEQFLNSFSKLLIQVENNRICGGATDGGARWILWECRPSWYMMTERSICDILNVPSISGKIQ